MKYRIFLDIETTGLDPIHDEILEIAVIKEEIQKPYLKQGRIIKEFNKKIIPQYIDFADPIALKINNFDKEIWEKEAVTFESIAQELFDLLSSGKIIAQNPNFDLAFIGKAFHSIVMKPNFLRYAIDTTTTSYLAWGMENDQKLSMDSIRELLGLSEEKSHTALKDAKDCRTIFYKALAKIHSASASVEEITG